MPSNTPNLNLYKKNPATDGDDTFNIETMLNENYDKIDAHAGDNTRHITVAERNTWNAKETTAGAQAKADAARDAAINTAALDATAKANAARDAAIDAAVAADASKLNANAYTAADVLAKLLTVDGAGSGQDSDMVDGYNAVDLLNTSSWYVPCKVKQWNRLIQFSESGVTGVSFLLNISGTRGSHVYNTSFVVNTSHAFTGSIVQLGSNSYSRCSLRLIVDTAGNGFLEWNDTFTSDAAGTDQAIYVSITRLRLSNQFKPMLALTPGSIPENYIATGEISSVHGGALVAPKLVSTVTTEAPLSVASQGMVSNLNAEFVGGRRVNSFALSAAYVNFGGTDTPMTTDEFITILTALGAFADNGHWVVRGGWEYAHNRIITDSGFGQISLAGAVVEVTGNSTFYTVLIITAPQAPTGETMMNANSEFIYAYNGPAYVNGWRKQLNNKNALAGTVGSTTFVTDANTIPKDGYYAVASTWTGSPFPGTQGPNQGYLEQFTWGDSPAYKVERFMPINAYDPSTRGQRYRILNNGVWEPWVRQWDSSNDVPLYAARRTIPGGENLNDYVGNGAYSLYVEGGAYLNGPPPGYYLLDVKVAESGYVTQDAISVFGTVRFFRSRTDGGVWSPWLEIPVKDYTGKISGVAAIRNNDTEFTLASTANNVLVAAYNPTRQGNYTAKAYLRMTAAARVEIAVWYADASGAETAYIVPSKAFEVGSYCFIPLFFNAVAGGISIVATCNVANAAHISSTIEEA